jgi:hypothetical protein
MSQATLDARRRVSPKLAFRVRPGVRAHAIALRQADSNNSSDSDIYSLPPANRTPPRVDTDDRPEVGNEPTDPPQIPSVRQLRRRITSSDVYQYSN